MSAVVTELNVYPLKSGGGTALREAELTPRGIRYDREFMLIRSDNRHLSQRESKRMALLRPAFDGAKLTVEVADQSSGPLVHAVRADGELLDVTVHRRPCRGIDQGDEAAGWFSDVVSVECRLVRFPADHVRPLKPEHGEGSVGYADQCPILLISAESLADLNSRLDEPLPMNRFRPNIVVSGWGRAFAEDDKRLLRIGETEIELVGRCDRCMITTIDQATGIKTSKEPLRALALYRNIDQELMFGMLGKPLVTGVLRVGDTVTEV